MITRETPEVVTKETPPQGITKEKPVVAMKEVPEVITKPTSQVVTTEKTFEPVRPIAHPNSKAPDGRQESVQIAKEKPAVAPKQMPEVITKPVPATAKKQMAEAVTKPGSQGTQKKAAEVITKPTPRVANNTTIFEPVRPIAHYSFKTSDGRQESVPLITHYYPDQIVHPLGTTDRHLNPKLMRAATIAQDRAHAHSRSMCWHYVKEALLASGVIDSRPKSEYARDAADDLVSNYGFKKLSVRDPFAAPIGSVLVYGTSRSIGHVEIRTKDGFVSDFRSSTPSRRPLIGVYAKL